MHAHDAAPPESLGRERVLIIRRGQRTLLLGGDVESRVEIRHDAPTQPGSTEQETGRSCSPATRQVEHKRLPQSTRLAPISASNSATRLWLKLWQWSQAAPALAGWRASERPVIAYTDASRDNSRAPRPTSLSTGNVGLHPFRLQPLSSVAQHARSQLPNPSLRLDSSPRWDCRRI